MSQKKTIYFTPLKDFPAPELMCVYLEGQKYRIVPGNERLLALAKKWEKDDLVSFDKDPTVDVNKATVSGEGTIKPSETTEGED